MDESSIRPPELPKPSAASSLPSNRLKNRLILGWSRLPTTAPDGQGPTHTTGHLSAEPVTLRGYGEDQFDIADSIDGNRSVLGMQSSLWSENTFTNKLKQSSSIAAPHKHHRDVKYSQNSMIGKSVNNFGASIVTKAQSTLFMGPETSTRGKTLPNVPHKESMGRRRHKTRDPTRMPHLSTSILYNEEGGWDEVASSIAFGETEFCYLQSEAEDNYKFSMQSKYPAGRILKNDFATMSKHGVMRSSVITGQSEMVSHEVMMKEQGIYHKLREIKLFRQFRLWKMFYVWQRTIKLEKYKNNSISLSESLLLLHPFYRSLVSEVIDHCAHLQSLPVLPLEPLVVYDQKAFATLQKTAIADYKAARDAIVDKLIQFLCKQGQNYVYHSLDKTPNAISMDKFNSLKVSQASTTVTITDRVLGPGTTALVNSMAASTEDQRRHSTSVDGRPKLTVSYTERAAIRTNCRKLANLFRLVDFVVRDSLYNSVYLALLKLQIYVEGYTPRERELRKMKLTSMGDAAMEVLADMRLLKSPTSPTSASGTHASHPHSTVAPMSPKSALKAEVEEVQTRPRSIFKLVVDIAAVLDNPASTQGHQQQGAEGQQNALAAAMKPFPTRTGRQSMLPVGLSVRTGDAAHFHHGTDETGAHGAGSGSAPYNRFATKVNQVIKTKYVISFDISLATVLRTFTEAITNSMKGAAFRDGLLSLDMCIELLTPIISEITPQPLEDRFANTDTPAHAVLRSCCEVIGIDYERAKAHAELYHYLCDTYQTHLRILENAEVTQLASTTPEEMAEHLELFRKSQERCLEVAELQDVGVFRLEFTALKAKILGIIHRCRAVFFKVIPELYVANGDIFYNELSRVIDILEMKHTTIDAFVRLVELFNKTTAETDTWTDKFQYIMSIKDILSAQGEIAKSEAVVRQNLTIVTVWQRFMLVMNDFEESIESKSKHYQSQLKQRTKVLVEPLERARLYLHATVVHDHNSDSDVVITQLAAYLHDVEVVLKKGREIEHYQTVLKCHVYSHTLLVDLSEDLQTMHVLWSLVKLIKELQISFMSVNFLDAASNEVEKQLRYAHTTILHKLKGDTINAVQIWLGEALAHLELVAPVIKKLQAPTQKSTHIQRVHTLLNRKIFDEGDVTVGELVDVVDILRHAAALDAIYEESLFEYNLEASAKTLQKRLNAAEFVFDNEKDNNALVFIANFHEIEVFLEDTAISLQACVNSKYSAPHMEELRAILASVESWKESNRQFQVVQEGYLRIRVLFTCARTARYLGTSVKYFKVLDEHWRNIMKLARTELRVCSVYDCVDIQENLASSLEAIALTDADLVAHIREQCMKFPKLYMIDANYLMDVFATLDPHAVFQKCRQVFPMLSDIIFLFDDAQTSCAADSYGEIVTFRKPCSARSSLVDWLRSIEAAINDKLEVEIKEHMHLTRHLTEDLKLSKTCEQSRLVAVQVTFWSGLLRNLQREPHTQHTSIRAQMLETVDQISMFSGLSSNHTHHMDKYHLRSLENLLILLISHRDLLNLLLESGDNDGSGFILETSIKKLWDSETSTLVVKQGQHKRPYGMKYVGFTTRLAITPLTDKFFLAVSNVVHTGSMACVFGPEGSGKHHTLVTLAQEFGYDVMPIDCRSIGTVDLFAQVVRAHLGSGFWGNYCNLCHLPQELLGVVMTVFSTIHVALAHQDQHIYIGEQRLDIIDRGQGRPKFCLLFNSPTAQLAGNPLPPSVRRQFRPLHFTSPDRKALFSVLLGANNFVMVPKIVARLDALCDYVIHYRLCPEQVLLKILLKCIPLAKMNYVHVTANATTQMGLFTKLLIAHIPWALQSAVTEDDLRFICNLFLEVVYLPDQDLKEFKRIATVSDCASILYNQVRHGSNLSVVVVGAPCTGKSTLIKEISANAVSDHNEELAVAASKLVNAGSSGAPPANQAAPAPPVQPVRKMQLYKRMLNIFTMANYTPCDRTSEYHHEGLAPAHHSPLVTAAVQALTSVLRSIDTAGHTQVLHLDTQSSLQFAYLHPQADFLSKYYSVPVKYVWECVELNHVDPATLVSVPMVCVKSQIYDVEDVLAYQLQSLATKNVHQLHELVTECVDAYIRPCLLHRSADSLLSDCTLAENVFKMILSVCSAGDLLTAAGSVKRWEHTVRRVVLLSCIWTVGVCSPTSREPFQQWFQHFFGVTAAESAEEKIFPTFDIHTTSLFDSSLVCPNDKEVYLEWALFDRVTMMEIMDKIPSSAESNSSAGASYISSEDRLRRSYQDIYYTTLLNQAADKASVLVPTPTGSAWMLLQASLMRSGGVVLVTGPAGSGKSMLMRQMLELSKAVAATRLSQDTAARWVCHITDCGPAELQQHMDHCKRSVLPLLMERKLPDKGSVMIDDVSMVQHNDNHTTCAEFFRTSCDSGELYFSQRNSWRPLQKYYTALGSNNKPGERNNRFLRHLLVLCCDEKDLETIFAQKLLSHCNVMTPDIAHDLALVTLNLARMCAYMLQNSQNSAESAVEHGVTRQLTAADRLFLFVNTTQPASSIADNLLSRVVQCLESMAGAYSSNDVVRVWDRTIADHYVRHPAFATILDAAHEHVTNAFEYQFGSFSTFMDKEKLLRSQGMEALVSTLYSTSGTEQAPPGVLPISYKANASGYYETKSGTYAGISCAETVRDLMVKKHGRNVVPVGISPDSLAFWTDVLALAAEVTAPRLSVHRSFLFLTGNHPAMHRKVLAVASSYLAGTQEFLRLDPAQFVHYSTPPPATRSIIAPYASTAVTMPTFVKSIKEVPSDAICTDDSVAKNATLSFQAAVTAAFLESFLTDNCVLRTLKQGHEHAAGSAGDGTLLAAAELQTHSVSLPAELFQVIERFAKKYSLTDATNLHSEDTDRSDRKMVIWHLNVSRDFCHTPNAWNFLHETLELRSATILHVLQSLGGAMDPTASRLMRDAMEEYLSRQRFVLSLDDCSPRTMEETLHELRRIPRFAPTISLLPCYETYESCDRDLLHLVGADLAPKLLEHVVHYAKACRDKLTAIHKSALAASVASEAYGAASIETVLTLYALMMRHGAVPWKRALLQCAQKFAVGSDENVASLLTLEETMIGDAQPKGASPNQDEPEVPLPAVQTTGGCDLTVLGDALLCVLYSRYCTVLLDDHAADKDFSKIADLPSAIHDLGLSTTLPASFTPSVTLFSAVMTLSHASTQTDASPEEQEAMSAQAHHITELVAVGSALPVDCHLRDVLASLSIAMLNEQSIHVVDHSFLSVLTLIDVLRLDITSMSPETLFTNSHFLTLNLTPPYVAKLKDAPGDDGGNVSLRRIQLNSGPVPSRTAVPMVLPAHSFVMSDLLLTTLLQDRASCLHPSVLATWNQLHAVHSDVSDAAGEAVLVDLNASEYSAQWGAALRSMYKPMHTLAALMQALVTIPSTQGLIHLGVWSEYKAFLHSACSVLYKSSEHVPSVGVVLSQSIQAFIGWLPNLLFDWEYPSVLLSVLLSLYLDTASASGQIMAQRVLQSLRAARHNHIGIVPIIDTDDTSDGGSESGSSVGGISLHERSDEDLSDEEDTSENFRLSDHTLTVLRQSLLLISQALESFAKTHGGAVPQRQQSALVMAADNSATIVSELRKNVEDWVLWVLDTKDLHMPYHGAYTPNWLDRLAVAMAIKPLIVLPTLLAGIAEIGFEHEDAAQLFGRKKHAAPTHLEKPAKEQAVVVLNDFACAKDTLSELEYGGTVSTLENFSHTFKAEHRNQFSRRNTAHTHSAYGASGETTTIRLSVLSAQPNAADIALRSALQVQESDGHLHLFLSAGESSCATAECDYTSAEMTALVRDKAKQADSPTNKQGSRELFHYVLLQCASLAHEHFAFPYKHVLDMTAKSQDFLTVELLHQQSLLVPQLLHGRALNALRLPVMPGHPSMKLYVEVLQYCYFVAAAVPMNCPASMIQIACRVRWLLVLFHVSVQCKLASTEAFSAIAVDTLIQAFTAVDILFTRAFHNTPKEEFLKASERSLLASHSQSHPPSTEASRRSSSVHGLHHNASLLAAADKAAAEPHRSEVHRYSAIAWSLDMLVVEIVDCLYAQLVTSIRLRESIRSVYLCYFTSGSLNPSAEYLIKGKVVLPHDLSRVTADRFFKDLRAYCDEESSVVELSDSTNGEASAVTLKTLWYGVDHIIDVFNNAHEARASKHVIHPRNVSLSKEALFRYDTIGRVRKNLQRVLEHLPTAIDIEEPEIVAKMKEHKKNVGSKSTAPAGPPVPGGASEYSMRRRRGERIVVSFDTREFDPLWAYLLAETQCLNRTLTALRQQVDHLLQCTDSVNLLQYFTQQGAAVTHGSADSARIASILQALHDGNAPSTLTSFTSGAREAVHGLKLEDWWKEIQDQKALLTEWLNTGYTPKIQLHLLRNPAGLLYAIKETFCMRSDGALDKLHFNYQMQTPDSVQHADLQTISKANGGCSVLITDLYLHNAMYHEKSNMLEFLPEHAASAYGKKLAVLVTVTKDVHAHNPEEYLCPVYVHSILPASTELFPCATLYDTAPGCVESAVMHIPMETTEDVEDCRMFAIAVHSGHRVTLPE